MLLLLSTALHGVQYIRALQSAERGRNIRIVEAHTGMTRIMSEMNSLASAAEAAAAAAYYSVDKEAAVSKLVKLSERVQLLKQVRSMTNLAAMVTCLPVSHLMQTPKSPWCCGCQPVLSCDVCSALHDLDGLHAGLKTYVSVVAQPQNAPRPAFDLAACTHLAQAYSCPDTEAVC